MNEKKEENIKTVLKAVSKMSDAEKEIFLRTAEEMVSNSAAAKSESRQEEGPNRGSGSNTGELLHQKRAGRRSEDEE